MWDNLISRGFLKNDFTLLGKLLDQTANIKLYKQEGS